MEVQDQKSVQHLICFSKFGINMETTTDIQQFCTHLIATRRITKGIIKRLMMVSIEE